MRLSAVLLVRVHSDVAERDTIYVSRVFVSTVCVRSSETSV